MRIFLLRFLGKSTTRAVGKLLQFYQFYEGTTENTSHRFFWKTREDWNKMSRKTKSRWLRHRNFYFLENFHHFPGNRHNAHNHLRGIFRESLDRPNREITRSASTGMERDVNQTKFRFQRMQQNDGPKSWQVILDKGKDLTQQS